MARSLHFQVSREKRSPIPGTAHHRHGVREINQTDAEDPLGEAARRHHLPNAKNESGSAPLLMWLRMIRRIITAVFQDIIDI